ncbi:hypothetical protein E4U40_004325 [Claviceps sp. LM458 group G5]|nr:hypothetical protein E4U40_004325 [Claviceps sp. LM458 group G5]
MKRQQAQAARGIVRKKEDYCVVRELRGHQEKHVALVGALPGRLRKGRKCFSVPGNGKGYGFAHDGRGTDMCLSLSTNKDARSLGFGSRVKSTIEC